MFKTEPHTNEKYKNQTLRWHGFDSKELFETNLEKKSEQLKLHGWSSISQIDYKFNSYGFRSDEFLQSDNVVSLGCSFTLGTGIAQYLTWSNIVSKTLGLANFNLAVDGGSADCCFRMAANWIPQLKPKIVLYQSPDSSRVEWFDGKSDRPHNMMATTDNQSLFYKEWIVNERNLELNHLKNLYAIQHLAESHGAQFIHISLNNVIRFDSARDLGHYGPKTHTAVANSIIRRLNWPKR